MSYTKKPNLPFSEYTIVDESMPEPRQTLYIDREPATDDVVWVGIGHSGGTDMGMYVPIADLLAVATIFAKEVLDDHEDR